MRTLLLLLAVGCIPATTSDRVKDSGTLADNDGDGFVGDEDCDEEDGTVHVGAAELCDGLDNDCNGIVDDGTTNAETFYLDADGDGSGDEGQPLEACALPEGYVAVAGDCDDADPATHPGAEESDCTDNHDYNCDGSVAFADEDGDGFAACEDCDDGDAAVNGGAPEACNGLDDDCDGEVDEDAADALTWYVDSDGDGYGTDTTVLACDQPDGAAKYNGDCDDTNTAYHPNADEFDCADPNDYNCDGSVGYDDKDADGYPACEECDDTSAAHHPGAVEVCDGVDDDCDTEVDEADAADASTWYADSDGDGFGDAATTQVACDEPSGYGPTAGDCDDSDGTEFPGAYERCDGDDDDCDGEVDEASAVDATGWYMDADTDGYGDPTTYEVACDAPAGMVANADDCDDTDFSEYPGADEWCDGDDDDCDGLVDEGDALDPTAWYGDTDGDGFGDVSNTIDACDAPAGYGADATDCDDTDAAVSPVGTETCNGIDDNCDGEIDEAAATDAGVWFADDDGDGFGDASVALDACGAPAGFVADNTDCDDTDPGAYPGATERCDGKDDDCDGVVDEDASIDVLTWFVDADGDGYGDAALSDVDCDQPSGFVADATDCNDAVAAVNPGAAEVCDGANVDEDCSGAADDADASATGQTAWYTDADADGYGVTASMVMRCDAPAGSVATGGDCDDAAGGTHPGATEVCDAANADEDCDGAADDADSAPTGRTSWYADADADGYGDLSVTTLACDAPAATVANATDCDDTSAAVHPGATEVCDAANADEDCDGLADDADTAATGKSTWYTDADTDTYGDATTARSACDAPAGTVADATDCDDTRATVHPGATEIVANGRDETCDGVETCYDDDDDDGYLDTTGDTRLSLDGDCADAHEALFTAPTTDCDDAAAAVHPGATELCNGIDDNCVGGVDEGISDTYYRDSDRDGYGDASVPSTGCSAPAGYVVDDSDCDDTLASVNPGEVELCDAGLVDEDCNGLVDDADPGVIDPSSWYADADTDTYGDAAVGETACAQPASFVADDTDCDDASASVHPGATETVANGVDDNCDGAETCYDDPDDDGYRGSAGTLRASTDGDCDDAYEALATDPATDCDPAVASVHPGATETCNLVDDDCDGSADEGVTTTYYADSDGDGYGDSTVTTAGCSAPSGYVAGSTDCDDTQSTVYPGAPTVCADHEINDCNATDTGCERVGGSAVTAYANTTFYTTTASDGLGQSLAKIGDVDGDGRDDLLLGTQNYDSSASVTNIGRAWLYTAGSVSGTTLLSTVGPRAVVTGVQRNGSPDWLAMQMDGGGDFDGDGQIDLVVGAPNTRGGTSSSGPGAVGEALLFSNPNATTLTRANASIILQGIIASDNLGYDVAGAFDLDDDGKDDFAAGAYLYDPTAATNAGAVVLAKGGLAAGTYTLSSTSVLLYTGESASDQLGQVVTGHSDLSGDGIGDLMISAYKDDNTGGTDAGTVYIIDGGTVPASSGITTAYDAMLQGQITNDALGRCTANAGDQNGDGYDDVIVGADGNGAALTGRAYVFFGPITTGTTSASAANVTFSGVASLDNFGRTCDGNGDFNGDGSADVMVGATGYDSPLSGAGGVWMWYGPVAAGSYAASTADFSFTGSSTATSDALGASLTFVGDTNADGFDDLTVAALNWDYGASNAGGVWLILGTGN